MKKTRIFAGLTALLLCFQTGISMTAFAQETETSSAVSEEAELSQIQEDCDWIALYMKSDKIAADSSVSCDEETNTIYITIGNRKEFYSHKKKIERFCKTNKFQNKYTILYYYIGYANGEKQAFPEPSEEEFSAFTNVKEQIQQFIDAKNQELGTGVSGTSMNSVYMPTDTFSIHAPTQEIADEILAYCEEQGFTETYQFAFGFTYAMDISDVSAMSETHGQIRQFMSENSIDGSVTIQSRYDTDGHINEFYLDVCVYDASTDAVENYCNEQGFSDLYDINYYSLNTSLLPSETEMDIEVKAGDVTLDETLDILDVITLNKALLGKETLNTLQNIAADANKDGSIDSFDSLAIMKTIVGILENTSDKQLSSSVKYLSKSVKSDAVEGKASDDSFTAAQTGFYLNLFQKAEQETPDENILISPYSVMQALAMTANGTAGETRSEMEQTFGGIPLEELNQYLYTQRTSQPDDAECRLSTANSIWYRDAFGASVKPEFLKVNADYYSADAFSAPFDNTSVTDINNWVSNKTDRMITQLLDPSQPIDEAVMMYLINAVTFDAKWSRCYTQFDVRKCDFTKEDGTTQKVSMMYSDGHDAESFYLADENASGFYKYYEGGRYAFAGILPNEGISVDEYISGLTADSLQKMLSNPERKSVAAGIPKFSYDYSITLNDALSEMGMPTAFTDKADFSNMSEEFGDLLYISNVLHKTHIEVFESGTKAAAVTAVEVELESEAEINETVILDRPFVYMIVDMETHLPVFMGAVKSIQ